MQTHLDGHIRARAVQIHASLYEKHASFINAKNGESIQSSYNYQLSLTNGDTFVHGYRENADFREALLSAMYLIIQPNRSKCNEFLMTLVKLFDSETKDIMLVDYKFYIYVADNLATFPYKHIDEILNVIYWTNRILALNGENCLTKVEGVLAQTGSFLLYR